MPVVALTDISIRNLKPVPGKRVTYLDKTLKGFGIRITENGQMSFVLTYGPNRARVKLGEVGPQARRSPHQSPHDPRRAASRPISAQGPH